MKKRVAMGISSMLAAALLLCSCAATEPEREDAEAGNNEGLSVSDTEAGNNEESSVSDTEASSWAANTEIKEASAYTKETNEQVYQLLDFDDEQEREFAERGFITAPE